MQPAPPQAIETGSTTAAPGNLHCRAPSHRCQYGKFWRGYWIQLLPGQDSGPNPGDSRRTHYHIPKLLPGLHKGRAINVRAQSGFSQGHSPILKALQPEHRWHAVSGHALAAQLSPYSRWLFPAVQDVRAHSDSDQQCYLCSREKGGH